MDIGPTEADKKYFMEMGRRMLDANPGLPMKQAPGMRKSKTKSKSRSRSRPRSRPRSRSRSRSHSRSRPRS